MEISYLGISLNKNDAIIKVIDITEVVNGVEQPYDASGKSYQLIAYDDNEAILYTLAGVGALGTITFTFLPNPHTQNIGEFEYIIQEDSGAGWNTIIKGTIVVADLEPDSLIGLIQTEMPEGILIETEFRTLRIRYWRLYLQTLIDPNIIEVDLEDYTKWPELINYLIAKLVVYDYILRESKKGLIKSVGGDDSEGQGLIKKIETGPSNVEFFESSKAISDMFKTGVGGNTPFDQLKSDLCMLAHRVRIYLPICGHVAHGPIIPIKAELPKPDDEVTILNRYYNEQ